MVFVIFYCYIHVHYLGSSVILSNCDTVHAGFKHAVINHVSDLSTLNSSYRVQVRFITTQNLILNVNHRYPLID